MEELLRDSQGLLLVFDVSNEKTFEVIRAWALVCETFNPSVMLCVGVEASGPNSIKRELEDAAQ